MNISRYQLIKYLTIITTHNPQENQNRQCLRWSIPVSSRAMNQPEPSSQTDISELKPLVSKLPGKVDRLTTENAKLRDEIRHLKKLKGQSRFRPNKKEPEASISKSDDKTENEKPASGSNSTPPKSKRPKKEERGRTAKPTAVTDKICQIDGVESNWQKKGYRYFTHIDVEMQFTATRYRREVWRTPAGKTVIAPLPAHVKGHFGSNLTALTLDLYHSCSVTQPFLLLDWLHSHDCSLLEGSLNNLLTQNHNLFHQEKDEMLDAGIASAYVLQVDDTGARHDGKNGYCTVIGNETFTVFASTSSKSRINFLTVLQGQRRCHVLNETAIAYMIHRWRCLPNGSRCFLATGNIIFWVKPHGRHFWTTIKCLPKNSDAMQQKPSSKAAC